MNPATTSPRTSSAARGALWMVACAFFYTIETSIIRALGPGWPSPVTLFWREVATCSVLLPLVLYRRGAPLRTRQPGLLLFRSITGTIGLLLSIYAIARLPLATATTLSFTRPMWIAVLAALFLGERMNRWKVLALIVGFSGVVWILRPGGSIADPVAAMADIAAAFVFAASLVSIRYMTATESPLTLLVYGQFLGLIFTIPLALYSWRTPDAHQLAILLSVGLVSLGTTISYIKALNSADASVVAPMEYLRLPYAMLAGLILLGEVPQSATLIGAGLILAGAAISAFGGARASVAAPGVPAPRAVARAFNPDRSVDEIKAHLKEKIDRQVSLAASHMRDSYWTDSRTGRNVGRDELAAVQAMEGATNDPPDHALASPLVYTEWLAARLEQAHCRYRETAPDPDGYGSAMIGTVIREMEIFCYIHPPLAAGR